MSLFKDSKEFVVIAATRISEANVEMVSALSINPEELPNAYQNRILKALSLIRDAEAYLQRAHNISV